jgi:hypothetical protein
MSKLSQLISLSLIFLLLVPGLSHTQPVNAWFLLQAPMLDKTGKSGWFDVERPLREWRHFSSFDTAKDCEAKREELTNSLMQNPNFPTPGKNLAERWFMFFGALKCVPVDLLKELVR